MIFRLQHEIIIFTQKIGGRKLLHSVNTAQVNINSKAGSRVYTTFFLMVGDSYSFDT